MIDLLRCGFALVVGFWVLVAAAIAVAADLHGLPALIAWGLIACRPRILN